MGIEVNELLTEFWLELPCCASFNRWKQNLRCLAQSLSWKLGRWKLAEEKQAEENQKRETKPIDRANRKRIFPSEDLSAIRLHVL